jgi:DNA-directed RNA polymerase subunit RPC12/RpoP
MPEVKREVRPVEVTYICDACGQGMMSRSGEMDPKSGDVEHRCLICNHQQTSDSAGPRTGQACCGLGFSCVSRPNPLT